MHNIIMMAIDSAIVDINRDLQNSPIGYHFTTEVRTVAIDGGIELQYKLLAVEDGEPTYSPIEGSDRRELILISEGLLIKDDATITEQINLRLLLEQRFITNCMRVLLVGIGSPLIIDVDNFERADNLKLISGDDSLLLP